jgi:hypothetical protein
MRAHQQYIATCVRVHFRHRSCICFGFTSSPKLSKNVTAATARSAATAQKDQLIHQHTASISPRDHQHITKHQDALGWLPHLAPSGIALLHDTGGWGMGCARTPSVLRALHGFDVIVGVMDSLLLARSGSQRRQQQQ